MKTKNEIEAYIKKLSDALAKEKKAYTSKDTQAQKMLSKDLQDRFETQINALTWVLKD